MWTFQEVFIKTEPIDTPETEEEPPESDATENKSLSLDRNDTDIKETVVFVTENTSEPKAETSEMSVKTEEDPLEISDATRPLDVIPKKRRNKNGYSTCKYCNQTFIGRNSLLNHERLKHTFEKPFKCDLCNKKFATSSSLCYHKSVHLNDRRFICAMCNKRFNNLTILKTHLSNKHTDPQSYQYSCTYCDKRYPVKSKLDYHIKQHVDGKNFCELCRQAFRKEETLQKHFYLCHLYEQVFRCDMCSNLYQHEHSLNSHKKSMHTVDATSETAG